MRFTLWHTVPVDGKRSHRRKARVASHASTPHLRSSPYRQQPKKFPSTQFIVLGLGLRFYQRLRDQASGCTTSLQLGCGETDVLAFGVFVTAHELLARDHDVAYWT